MTWPWQKPAPLPPFGKCPGCGAEEVTRLAPLLSWRPGHDDTKIGGRYVCERCAVVFSVSPSGAFKPHPHALAIQLGEMMPEPAAQTDEKDKPETRPGPRRPPELIARERPSP